MGSWLEAFRKKAELTGCNTTSLPLGKARLYRLDVNSDLDIAGTARAQV